MEDIKRGCPLKNQFISLDSAPLRINPDYVAFISDKKDERNLDLSKTNTAILSEIINAFLDARKRFSLFGISRDRYKQIIPFIYFHRDQFHLSKELRQYLIVAHGENYSSVILDEIAKIYHHPPQELIQKAIKQEELTYLEKMRICNECTFHELNYLENQLPRTDPIFKYLEENRPKVYR